MIVHGPPWLYFEPLKLLNFDLMLIWIQLFHSNTDPDHRATIEAPPLPISSDFFSTFIDVSDSGPRSQPGNERNAQKRT